MNKLLELINISLSFWDNSGTESFIFEELNLDIYAGRIYRFSGENGSGKSSLVKLVKGSYKPNDGKVILKPDIKIFAPNFEDLPSDIRVKDYISFYSTDATSIIDQLALKDILKQKISSLSTGERQRLVLVPLFVEEYDLIIFDESFKYIDEARRTNITGAIEKLTSGSAIIYIEHEIEDLFKASDLLEIKDKKIHHTILVEDVQTDQKIPIKSAKKRLYFWHLFISHKLLYIGFLISSIFFQVAPMALYTDFSSHSNRDLTVLTMSDKGKKISEEVKEELFGFERVGYSMEYKYRSNIAIDPNLDDESCVIHGPLPLIMDWHVVGGYLSFNAIITLSGATNNVSPILKIKAIINDTDNENSYYAVSKKNYIILRQIENFKSKYFMETNAPIDSDFAVGDGCLNPVSIPKKYSGYLTEIALINKGTIGEIKKYPVSIFDHEDDYLYVILRTDFISSLVDDDSYISLIVKDKRGYKLLQKIAKEHDLNTFTNYISGERSNVLALSMTAGVFLLSILVSCSLLSIVLSIDRKRFELLKGSELKRERDLLVICTFLISTLVATIVFMPFKPVFALVNIGIYVFVCLGFLLIRKVRGFQNA